MLRLLILTILVSFGSIRGDAQHHEGSDESVSLLNAALQPDDSLKRVLHEHGKFEGHFRTYFMNTLNHGHNPDSFKGNLYQGVEAQPETMHNKTEMHHFGVRMDYYF